MSWWSSWAVAGCQVRIQPLLDPTEVAPVDGYEVPQRLRAAVRARQIADVFPFGTCLSENMDLDHTKRYVSTDYGGPPGQTRLGNLGPLARPSHRAVTHGGWAKPRARTRLLRAPLTERTRLDRHQPRHPRPRPRGLRRRRLGGLKAETSRDPRLEEPGLDH